MRWVLGAVVLGMLRWEDQSRWRVGAFQLAGVDMAAVDVGNVGEVAGTGVAVEDTHSRNLG